MCWVVTNSSLVTVWALCYLHRNNLNCFVVTFLTSLLKFQPGNPQPHWWSLLGQKQSTVWGVLVICTFMRMKWLKRIVTILVYVHQPHGLRFSTAPFLVSLQNIKCMLPTIVSNKTLLLCIIRVLKEHTSFLMITLKGSRPLLIKLMDIATAEEMAALYHSVSQLSCLSRLWCRLSSALDLVYT